MRCRRTSGSSTRSRARSVAVVRASSSPGRLRDPGAARGGDHVKVEACPKRHTGAGDREVQRLDGDRLRGQQHGTGVGDGEAAERRGARGDGDGDLQGEEGLSALGLDRRRCRRRARTTAPRRASAYFTSTLERGRPGGGKNSSAFIAVAAVPARPGTGRCGGELEVELLVDLGDVPFAVRTPVDRRRAGEERLLPSAVPRAPRSPPRSSAAGSPARRHQVAIQALSSGGRGRGGAECGCGCRRTARSRLFEEAAVAGRSDHVEQRARVEGAQRVRSRRDHRVDRRASSTSSTGRVSGWLMCARQHGVAPRNCSSVSRTQRDTEDRRARRQKLGQVALRMHQDAENGSPRGAARAARREGAASHSRPPPACMMAGRIRPHGMRARSMRRTSARWRGRPAAPRPGVGGSDERKGFEPGLVS